MRLDELLAEHTEGALLRRLRAEARASVFCELEGVAAWLEAQRLLAEVNAALAAPGCANWRRLADVRDVLMGVERPRAAHLRAVVEAITGGER
jgi:hypothetical protein